MVEVLGLSSFTRWRPSMPRFANVFSPGHAGYSDYPTLELQP